MNPTDSPNTEEKLHRVEGPPTLDAHVARLELLSEQERSLFKRSNIAISFVALLISVAIGAYNIWDRAIVRPSENKDKQIEEIRRIAARLGEIDRELIKISFTGNTELFGALSRVANIEKLGLLTKADRIFNDVRHEIDFPEYFVLGYAQLSFGNNDLAIDYYQRAYAVASTELSKAESLRGYAQAVLRVRPETL